MSINTDTIAAPVRPKLKPEVKAAWLEALRSGEYKQTREMLESPVDGGFCCLGVLCNLAEKEGVVERTVERLPGLDEGDERVVIEYDEKSGLPTQTVDKWALEELAGAFHAWTVLVDAERIGEEHGWRADEVGRVRVDLASLNDNYGFTFADLADLIEEQY